MCNLRIITFKIDENAKCAICLDDKTECYLPCSHKFHYKCILTWLFRKVTCPLCRTKLINQVMNHSMKGRDYVQMESVSNVSGHIFYK